MAASNDIALYAIDPVAAKFHDDWTSWLKAATGPVGCGKTWTSIWDMVFHACRAVPPSQRAHVGSRRARYAVVRKTYPRLETTTLASMQSIFRKSLKVTYGYPIIAEITVPDPFCQGESIDIEFVLIAVANEQDEMELKKLRSLELTGAYINEADEYDTPGLIGPLDGRCGRYPVGVKHIGASGNLEDTLGKNGKPVGYTGGKMIILDYNKGPDSHWLCLWHRNENGERPKGASFYDYPSPLLEIKNTSGDIVGYEPNPEAASYASKQPSGLAYWQEKIETNKHDPAYIHSLILNKYGSIKYGHAVFQNFDRARHMLPVKVVIDPTRHIVIGFDHSGLNPAMSIMQVGHKGIILVDEIVAFDTPPDDFLNSIFVPWFVNTRWRRQDVEIVCDPADPRGRSIGGSLTMVQALHKVGFVRAHPAALTWGRDPVRMIRGVNEAFSRGMLYVNPGLKWTGEALAGRYSYKRLNSNMAAVATTPTKNEWSHIADAVQLGVNQIRIGQGFGDGSGVAPSAPVVGGFGV